MIENEWRHREKQSKQFGKLLVQRNRRNLQPQQTAASQASLGLGRYLRAARINAGLPPAQLAYKAGISTSTLIALEQGLILPQDIKLGWLKQLARVLNEDMDDFIILLGKDAPQLIPIWKRISNQIQIPRLNLLARPVYATVTALLTFVIFVAMLMPFNKPSLYPVNTFIDVNSGTRLNLVKAETGIRVLIPSTLANLPPLINVDSQHRLNLKHAEEYIQHQAPIPPTLSDLPPTLIAISPETRLNMIKADLHIENQILIQNQGFQPLDIKYPKVIYSPNFQFSRRFGGI